MAQELTLPMESAITRAREEAERLTAKLDLKNAEKNRKPLIESHEMFVQYLTSEFLKLLIHRAILKP